jgi:hypothetical protein
MGALREDANKVFIGSLNVGTIKPQVCAMLAELGLKAYDVIVPPARANSLAVAFAVFEDPNDCYVAISKLQGLVFPQYAPGQIMAHRGDPSHGGL